MEEIIEKHKNDFYNEHAKHFFFKRKQKLMLAHKILSEIDLNTLIANSCQNVISNGEKTNKVYVNYQILKHFACSTNYKEIVTHFLHCIQDALTEHSELELHLNLKSFSVSSLKTHEHAIQLFLNEFNGNQYVPYIKKMYVYNTPIVFELIQTVFDTLLPNIKKNEKIEYIYYRDESSIKLKELLHHHH